MIGGAGTFCTVNVRGSIVAGGAVKSTAPVKVAGAVPGAKPVVLV